MRSLFSSAPRSDPSPKRPLEATFEFYDRVDTPYWAEVRTVMDEWFTHYPEEHRGDLRSELYSKDERKSQSAFWELLLHELYTSAGFRVSVHPTLPATNHKPDFRISKGSIDFYLEARVVSGESDEVYRRDRRRRAIYEAINRAKPENFYVRLEILIDGDQQPPTEAITSSLESWLAGLDPQHVADHFAAGGGLRDAPSTEFESRGWRLRFTALPVKQERRGKLTGPMLGVLPAETKVFDPGENIRRALKRKGRRYGDLDLPLVVALAIDETAVHEEDISTALYGSVVSQLDASDPSREVGRYRRRDGYFGPRRGRRVSAVLTVETPRPWMAPRLTPRLWLNPWAATPYDGERLWAWTTLRPESDEFVHGDASTTTSQLLDLSTDWPQGEPFPRASRHSA